LRYIQACTSLVVFLHECCTYAYYAGGKLPTWTRAGALELISCMA
jgi:hypothetical protein